MYPKWKYHTTEAPKIVYNAQEELILGDEWEESPASFFQKVEAIVEKELETLKIKKTKVIKDIEAPIEEVKSEAE